ncbi:MAG: hypothetical protein C4527_17075 [Candidatus Omnitrophota bacterium]|jgi:predicted CXXCH cytochrome family protein|nr:MAG: hypothetical protein C4527_17075 [Candidatus Omnitrophota bacterium]
MSVKISHVLFFVIMGIPFTSLTARSQTDSVEIEITAINSRILDLLEFSEEGTSFFDRTSSGNHVVGIGEKVYLMASSPNMFDSIGTLDWSIHSAPAGSRIQLVSDLNMIVSLVPDRVGLYEIKVSMKLQVTGVTGEGTKRILAASYAGVGGTDDAAPAFPNCTICHSDKVDSWRETQHADALRQRLNGLSAKPFETASLKFLSVGYDTDPAARNGGFDDIAANINFDLNELAARAREAWRLRQDKNPANDIDVFAGLPNELKAKANVQCENCHGAGSQHFSLPDRISKSFSGITCSQCHDAGEYNSFFESLASSQHSFLPDLFRRFPIMLRADCGRCHAAQQFVHQTINKNTTPTPVDDLAVFGVTCVACHDPHSTANPKQLRTMEDVILENGRDLYRDGGMGNLCAQCHQSRVLADLETEITFNRSSPHYGPQADVVLGINAWGFGSPYRSGESIHKLVTEDSCVTCHMADQPDYSTLLAEGEEEEECAMCHGTFVGGHTFKVVLGEFEYPADSISNFRNACYPCHLNANAVNRVLPHGRDYDGNGVVEGVQTEVRGLLARIAGILQERYPELQMTDNGAFDVSFALFSRLSFSEKSAIYNYHLVVRDGSYGIHNTQFVFEVLQRTLNALSG